MVTIRTKKIAIATTPTPPYPITEVVSIVCGLGVHRQRNWRWRLRAEVHCPSCFTSTLYSIVRHQLLNRMSQQMYDIIPGSGGNTFHQAVTTGMNEECIKISGSLQTRYQSVDHYLQLIANPSTYATHTEILAVNQLYNIQIQMRFAVEPYPTPPGANTRDVLYTNEHYSTLQFNNISSSS